MPSLKLNLQNIVSLCIVLNFILIVLNEYKLILISILKHNILLDINPASPGTVKERFFYDNKGIPTYRVTSLNRQSECYLDPGGGGATRVHLHGMCEHSFSKRPILKVFNMLKLYP